MIVTVPPVLGLDIVDFRDMTTLAIADVSQYTTAPITYTLQITAPGYPMISVDFTPGSVNVYHCIDLGIECPLSECCPLPDGVYDVILTVVPDPNNAPSNAILEKTFIKVDQLKCAYQKAFLKVDLECDCHNSDQSRYKRELQRIDLFINGAVAAANDCNNYLAYKLYNKAETMLNNINCKFGLPDVSCNVCQPCAMTSTCSSCNN